MKITKMLFMALASSILFVSCSDDNDDKIEIETPLGVYDNGILIVNEGNGSAGTISFITNDFATVSQNIYGAVNSGDGIGGYVQSIFFDGNRAFIVSNGSNKITVVNRYTFELIGKIETGFDVPRYGVVVDGKAYVTNLASFSDLTDDFISVINLSTLTVESTIAVNAIAERIVEENGKLYVANGSYGAGSTVTVINSATGMIESTIDVGISPNSLEEENGFLYVLCGNYADNSKLVKINLSTNQKVSEIEMTDLVNAQNLNIDNNKVYFTVNSDVFSDNLAATSISSIPLFSSTATTLYGFGVENGKIFVGDAKDYASDGEVFIYTTSGTLQKQFSVGLIPSGFYFND
ncbi:YncE family protein [Flavobacterium sp. SM2513]|uniref:YncE family protein n=1 Tax=Flavobacterium sp. SM2513 TaxID=3424766 RepID=UPI003D7FF1B7